MKGEGLRFVQHADVGNGLQVLYALGLDLYVDVYDVDQFKQPVIKAEGACRVFEWNGKKKDWIEVQLDGRDALCHYQLKVTGRLAILDCKDPGEQYEPGQCKIRFADSKRRVVTEISWKPKRSKQLKYWETAWTWVDRKKKISRKVLKSWERLRNKCLKAKCPSEALMNELVAIGQGEFQLRHMSDARRHVKRMIVDRRGQPQFRRAMLQRYGWKCAITGSTQEEVLEAAHIIPYKGERTNNGRNGILLRADLHSLFDLGLIGINEQGRVIVSPKLTDPRYTRLRNTRVTHFADAWVLKWHREQYNLR